MGDIEQRILVTGGAGFIGQHVVQALLVQGHTVVVLDTAPLPGRLLSHPGLRHIVGDIAEPQTLADAMAGCTAVVHLAALASVPLSVANPALCFNSNVVGTENVLAAVRKFAISGRVILASSAAVYGVQPTPMPYTEAMANSATLPSPYAASKRMNEHQAAVYRTCYGMNVHALRFFNVYGQGQVAGPTAGVLTHMTARLQAGEAFTLYGDGGQQRDFVFIDDVVQAIFAVLFAPAEKSVPEVMNIGSGQTVTLLEALTTVANVLQTEPRMDYQPASAGDVRYSCAAIETLRAFMPGWQPTPLNIGLQKWLAPQPLSRAA